MLAQEIEMLTSLKETLSSMLKQTEEELSNALSVQKREQDEAEACKELLEHNKFYHDKKTRKLAAYFKEKGYLITRIGEVSETSKAKYALAKHILSAVDVFRPFLRFVYERKADVYDTRTLETTDKTAICNFCAQLKKMGWLEWKKDKASITIERRIPKPEYSFFDGVWAEDAARYLIEKTLHGSPVRSCAVYRSVKLERLGIERNRDVHELDLIVEFRDRFYIFEVKSGVTLGVERWIGHARLFNDEENGSRFIMCCNDDTIDARLFRPYRLFHLNRLVDEFSEMLRKEFSEEFSLLGKTEI